MAWPSPMALAAWLLSERIARQRWLGGLVGVLIATEPWSVVWTSALAALGVTVLAGSGAIVVTRRPAGPPATRDALARERPDRAEHPGRRLHAGTRGAMIGRFRSLFLTGREPPSPCSPGIPELAPAGPTAADIGSPP